jgi:hypothetical protein
MFYRGQKVICVDAKPEGLSHWGLTEAPVEGAIYTVRRYFLSAADWIVWLDELERDDWTRSMWGPDAGYDARRFRPLVGKKTDVSIFERIFNPDQGKIKKRELEDA